MYELASTASGLLLPYGVVGLVVLSFLNSSVSPVSTEFLLVPLVLLMPEEATVLAAASAAASAVGAVFGYYLGVRARGFGYAKVGGRVEKVEGVLQRHGVAAVALAALGPAPFKPICFASGFFRIGAAKVFVTALVTRSARFLGVAYAVAFYGRDAVAFIETNALGVSVAAGAAVVVAYAVYLGYSRRADQGQA